MSRYVVTMNQPGYLPESDPAEFDTLADAKSYLASERKYFLSLGYGDDFPIGFITWTPLRQITRADITRYGAVTYGEFSDGYRLNIAIAE